MIIRDVSFLPRPAADPGLPFMYASGRAVALDVHQATPRESGLREIPPCFRGIRKQASYCDKTGGHQPRPCRTAATDWRNHMSTIYSNRRISIEHVGCNDGGTVSEYMINALDCSSSAHVWVQHQPSVVAMNASFLRRDVKRIILDHAERVLAEARRHFDAALPGLDILCAEQGEADPDRLAELHRAYPRAHLWLEIFDLTEGCQPKHERWKAAVRCRKMLLSGEETEVVRQAFEHARTLPAGDMLPQTCSSG